MKLSSLKLGLLAGLALGVAPAAFATGTDAGVTVSNTASVDFFVGGVDQPDVPSNTLTFKVDRRVLFTVAESGGAATQVVPGSSGQVLTFTVTNDTNGPIDIRLVAQQTGVTTPFVGAAPFDGPDNFNATGPIIRVENGLAVGYQSSGPNQDTATFIDELAESGVATVYIISSIGSGQINGDEAAVALVGIAAGDVTTSGDGSYTATSGTLASDLAETNTGTANEVAPNFIDTVFGDAAGDVDSAGAADTAGNGQHSDTDQYNVVTASIAVTKSSTVVSDPFSSSNPKAIPGAVIEYCIDVNNTGTAAASTITLTDAVPANTTFVSGSIKSAATGSGSACTVGSGTTEDDNSTDDLPGPGTDEADTDGGNFNAGNVTVTTPSIGAGSRWKATFRVTVD